MFALTKAASAAESGSNLQCKFSLQCFATVIHRKSLGKGPLVPIGISKKSYRLRTVKIKELIKCRQCSGGRVPGAVSSWSRKCCTLTLANADPCLPVLACHGRPKLGREQHWEQHPNLILLCTLVATNLQHICSSYTILAKKSCVRQI